MRVTETMRLAGCVAYERLTQAAIVTPIPAPRVVDAILTAALATAAEPESEAVRALQAENDKLRNLLAHSPADCAYCGLPKADLAKCADGFPGCGRADDMLIDFATEQPAPQGGTES